MKKVMVRAFVGAVVGLSLLFGSFVSPVQNASAGGIECGAYQAYTCYTAKIDAAGFKNYAGKPFYIAYEYEGTEYIISSNLWIVDRYGRARGEYVADFPEGHVMDSKIGFQNPDGTFTWVMYYTLIFK